VRGRWGQRPPWRPESDTVLGGDERMKRRGDSTGFASTKPSNGESNPATQHAGDMETNKKEGEGGYEVF
jgi:hypothetical protein